MYTMSKSSVFHFNFLKQNRKNPKPANSKTVEETVENKPQHVTDKIFTLDLSQ